MSEPGAYRHLFHIPQYERRDVIYLCGNSLGLMPKKARDYVNMELDDWAALGVEGHLHARHPWLPYHEFLTNQMARVVGAKPMEVVVMNSLTVNIHLLFTSFYRPVGERRKILVENDVFPSDLYAVQSQIRLHGGDPDTDLIFWKPLEEESTLRYDVLEELVMEHRESLALIFVSGVNYYTGQAFDLERITRLGHGIGIPVGFDLAHGAGNIPYRLHDSGADFAVWCSYKYLNSGPGGLSGVFIHERHARAFDLPRLAGWWGHNKETRFGMRDPFDPLPGAEGWQLSNPPILPMAAMRASLEIFDQASMEALRAGSITLTGRLDSGLRNLQHPDLRIFTPEHPGERGCQLSLYVRTRGREVFAYLHRNGVIADWREPNVIRVAPVPLYNTLEEVDRFIELFEAALKAGN